jgi:hypothetical protein
MKLLPLIKEVLRRKHDFNCVMLHFNFPEINKIEDMINPDDIYMPEDSSYGLETDPHVTLLYGLHDGVSIEDIKKVISKVTFDLCRIDNPSVFENEEYDVLKYDVEYATRGGAFLHKINNELKNFPYTSDFPEYHPHLTIAYLKSGRGEKYVEMIKGTTFTLSPKYVVYSKTNATTTKIPINLR